MESQTLIERLSGEIVKTIRDERIAPGESLPSARHLAERFSVTVPTVREALRRLEGTGAVVLRHGSGTYVGTQIDRRILNNPYYHAADGDAVIELLDARIAIEPGIAALAARNCRDDVVAELESKADVALQLNGSARVGNFHIEVAAATGNRAVKETVESLMTLNADAQQAARSEHDRLEDHAEHLEILDAIKRRDEFEAAHRAERHLRNIKRSFEEAQGRNAE